MQRKLSFALAAALAAASCTEQANTLVEEPTVEISRVTVEPGTASVEVGKTIRLTATVIDTDGNEVDDRDVDWFTQDATVATVTSDGVVTGKAAGSATVTATVEGKRGNARVTVSGGAPTGVVITSVSPNPLVEGQPATITGSNFGLVASNNRVTVDGVIANVTAATATTIQFMVPQFDCKPARGVDVQVRMLATESNVFKASVRPAQYFSLSAGQLAFGRDPTTFCVQLPASATGEAYLIGVQSVEENVTSVTPAALSVSAAGAAGNLLEEPVFAQRFNADSRPQLAISEKDFEQAPQDRRTRAEFAIQRRNYELFHGFTARAAAQSVASMSVPSVPAGVRVGDALNVRVPAWSSQCTQFAPVTAVVRHITARSIWLEDTGNPAGGYTLADYQALGTLFENTAYAASVDYFGEPTDLDRNGRIVFLVTKEVNRQNGNGDQLFDLGAFVKTANYFARTTCPSSNEGEYIYLRAVDPAGRFGRVTDDTSGERLSMMLLLSHEFAHVIQFGQQMPGNAQGNAFQPVWMSEGQATFVEEIVGHRLSGRSSGGNYGGDVVWVGPWPLGIWWYRGLTWSSLYYGFVSNTVRTPNAPEQCSWLDFADKGNNGPCAGTDNLVYGMGYLFMRWLADQFGPTVPGGERAVMRALVENKSVGFAAIQAATGVPIDQLLVYFAAALYVDDRIPNAAPGLRFTTWDMTSIESRKTMNARLLPRDRGFNTFTDNVSVRGASTAYFRVSGTSRGATSIKATSPNGTALPAHMRLWLVRLQ